MGSLPDLFDATYLINLPERRDRLRSANKELGRAGWEIGQSAVKIFTALRFTDPSGFPSAPVRGCFQSHLRCLQLAHEKEARNVLMVEDDIAVSASLPHLTSSIGSQLSAREWDIVYFGHYGTGKIPLADRNTEEGDLRFEEWSGEILTTYFYGINSRILPRLINHLNKHLSGRPGDQDNGPMPIDGAYNVFRRNNPDVRCLIAYPKLGWQTPSRSDITPHALDKFPVFRSAQSFLRKLKQMSRFERP